MEKATPRPLTDVGSMADEAPARSSGRLIAVFVLSITVAFVYTDVVTKLVIDWWSDANYSYAFVIVPIAVAIAWRRRDQLVSAPAAGRSEGLLLAAVGLALLVLGTLGIELFLTRVSLLVFAAGCVLFLFGRRHLAILAFPLLLVALTIPLPALVVTKIALPLQFMASSVAEHTLMAVDIPVLRDGNVLILQNATLQVAEACSGLRSIFGLLTLAVLVGWTADARHWVRATIVVLAVPLAVVVNGFRVTATAIAASWFGAEPATGILHEVFGWILFVGSLLLLMALLRVLTPDRRQPVPVS